MKIYAPVFLLILFFSSCGFKELPVEYDYSYKGNFKRYRTFELMSASSADTSLTDQLIKKSILARMKFLGLRRTDRRPHLIIGYKIFNDSLRFNGYLQPSIEEWVKTQNQNLSYDPQKYTLQTGTLLIQFFDRRLNRSIWQGYATTVYGNIDYNNQSQLKNVVYSILDKYRFWAEGFIEGKEPAAEKEL
jgi:Domain of unknown function (DUF4136)